MRGAVLLTCTGIAGAVGPIQKVLSLLDSLKEKVNKDGATETKQFEAYTEWYKTDLSERGYAIETGESKEADLKAAIEQLNAEINKNTEDIETLTNSISQNDKDLQEATGIRNEENSDFKKTEKELVETVDTLVRAGSVLQKAGLSGSAGSAAQLKAMFAQVATGLSSVMEAASISSDSKARLAAFLQDDRPSGAPEAAAYESHSTGILDTLAELKVKAEQELADLRKDEMQKKHQYEMLAQSLTDQINTQTRDQKSSQADLAKNTEAKGVAEGDLATTQDNLKSDRQYKADLEQQYEVKTSEWDQRSQARAEEIATLEKAIQILSGDKFTAAAGRRLPSLLQVRSKDFSDARAQVASLLQSAANRLHSVELAQIALRARAGDDPFVKVRGLIENMIKKLTTQAAEEASHKQYCDEEKSKSVAKREKFTNKVDDLNTRIDSAEAGTSKLKEEIATLSSEVAAADKAMAEATKLRQDENAEYNAAMADYEEGQNAINAAIQVLQEHYAEKPSLLQEKPKFGGDLFEGGYEKRADGASGIIGILEVAASDFARMEAEGKATESAAQKAFTKMKNENDVNRAKKTTAVKSKGAEVVRITNLIADLKNDRAGSQKELDAVLTYLNKLRETCEFKPMPFAERAARRKQEIESLKNALEILEAESETTSFLQRRK